jgi:hypothetical protein
MRISLNAYNYIHIVVPPSTHEIQNIDSQEKTLVIINMLRNRDLTHTVNSPPPKMFLKQ